MQRLKGLGLLEGQGFHMTSISTSEVTEHSKQKILYEKHVYRKSNLWMFWIHFIGMLKVHKSFAVADFWPFYQKATQGRNFHYIL